MLLEQTRRFDMKLAIKREACRRTTSSLSWIVASRKGSLNLKGNNLPEETHDGLISYLISRRSHLVLRKPVIG